MRNPFPFRSLLVVLLTLIFTAVPGHNTLLAEKKKIILLNADTIEGGRTAAGGTSEPYRSVIGNVRFQHGAVTLSCDWATEFEKERKIVLGGKIAIIDDRMEIRADNGIYYPDKERGELSGNVRGRMRDGSLMAKSRKAVVERRQNRIWLYDDVVAWGRNEQLSGDIVMVHIKERGGSQKQQQVDKIEVTRNALLAARDTLSTDQARYNQISGRKIVIGMNDRGKLSNVTVTGEAESLLHLYDEENKPSGMNYSSGDMMKIRFTDGKLERATVQGNVEGKQYPASYRENQNINLRKFAWRATERPF